MVRVISQETFDAAVKENVEEFEMSLEDAIKEAKDQFEAQGVNLANIVISKNEDLEHDVHKHLNAIKQLMKQPKEESVINDLITNCQGLSTELSKGLAERVMATKVQGYETLIQLVKESDEIPIKRSAIKALANLMDGNPDPLEKSGCEAMIECFSYNDKDMNENLLDWCLNCCVRHEDNRQNLVRNGILDIVDRHFQTAPVKVVQIWQALVQDDDVRVPFGKAHDNARLIVEEYQALDKLLNIIKETNVAEDLSLYLSCVSSLTVRNEYCQHLLKQDGLSTFVGILNDPDQKFNVIKESLRVIKTLCGNDEAKIHVQKCGGIPIIVNAITKFKNKKSVCSFGCKALGAICLRNPDNAKAIIDSLGAELLVEILRIHQDEVSVLTVCCSAIRNIVSRSPQFRNEFIARDVEKLLNSIKEKHPKVGDAAKSALRDLGLKVVLEEQWKGGLVKNE